MKLIALYKAITYRLLGSMITFLISWLLTKSFKVSLSISVLEVLGKIALYYVHERVWYRIVNITK